MTFYKIETTDGQKAVGQFLGTSHLTRWYRHSGVSFIAIVLAGCSSGGPTIAIQCQQLQATIDDQTTVAVTQSNEDRIAYSQKRANLAALARRVDNDQLLSTALSYCRNSQEGSCAKLRQIMTGEENARSLNPPILLAQAEVADSMANAIEDVELADPQLREQRNRLLQLYRSTSEVSKAQAELIDAEGLLQAEVEPEIYEQISNEHSQLSQQVQQQRSSIGIYCSMN